MPRRRRYQVIYAPVVYSHLRRIERKYYGLIKEAIELQLEFEPETETPNRKQLAPSTELEADGELRCGPNNRFRVFYWVDQASRKVFVVAVGVKTGNRLRIGREEVKL